MGDPSQSVFSAENVSDDRTYWPIVYVRTNLQRLQISNFQDGWCGLTIDDNKGKRRNFKANERLSSFANVCPGDAKYFFAESVHISIRDECERGKLGRKNSLAFMSYMKLFLSVVRQNYHIFPMSDTLKSYRNIVTCYSTLYEKLRIGYGYVTCAKSWLGIGFASQLFC